MREYYTTKAHQKFILIDSISILNFRTLSNFIPVIRNEHSWPEFIIAGLVSGILGGYLFSDPAALGFEVKKKHIGKFSYKTQCILKGTACGLIFGVMAGVYSLQSGSRSSANELKKWEKYWKQRLVVTYLSFRQNSSIEEFFNIFFFSPFQNKEEKTD